MKKDRQIGYGLAALAVVLLVTLSLVKADVDEQDAFLCEVVSKDPSFSMEDCPAHNGNTSWLIIAAFGVSFVIFGTGIYLLFMPEKQAEQKIEPKEIDESQLDGEEKRIYAMLKGGSGSAYQIDIIKDTGYSKVKVTRVLDRLESKGIIERRRRGMTNIIFLK